MSQENSLSNIGVWQRELGLLPVPLYPGNSIGRPFVLLNGSKGNFCLDVHGEKQEGNTRSIAWSSNVSHYVSVFKDYVEVQRWDQSRSPLARYSIRSVEDNLEKFHDYLEKDAPSQDLSIVSHAIRVFRSLRASLGVQYNGPQALRAFLCLLACTTDQVERNSLVLVDWALDSQSIEVASTISDNDWQSLQDDLVHGRRLEHLESDLTLLLRHAAGQLFQEAHYEAIFAPQPQLLLAGFTPAPVTLNRETTSTGLHFTPPALARSLVEEALVTNDVSLKIFDPACGSGEFLRETLRQLELRNYRGLVKISGWDISQAACDMAKFVLAWEKRNIDVQVDVDVRCVDSLDQEETWPSDTTNIFMNPPFVSWQDMNPVQRGTVSRILQDVKEKIPDLSHAFLLKASTCLSENGVLGAIVPSSLLDSASARKLRQQLSKHVSPQLLARLGSQFLFPGAMIDAAFYIARNTSDTDGKSVAFWADHRSVSNSIGLRALRKLRGSHSSSAYPVIGDGFDIYQTELGQDGEGWSPRPYKAWIVLQTLSYMPRVKDLFSVMQGASTGYNRAFILSRGEWLSLPKSEKVYFRPVVINRSIESGVLYNNFYTFYPHGKLEINDEAELEKKLSVYCNKYLIPSKNSLLRRARVDPNKWWKLNEHRAWQVEMHPKLVSTHFGDAGSFAYDSTGEYVVVQGHAWLPKDSWLDRQLKEENTLLPKRLVRSETISGNVVYAYLAIINSDLFSTLLSATSNSVGGGQWDLSKKYIDNMAIPDLLNAQINPELLGELTKIGQQIANGERINDEIYKELVDQIYGLTRGV